MAIPIVMPRLGDFMTEGVVARWSKKPGEHVEQDEILAEIESEKVTYDLEAIGAGIFHPVVAEGASSSGRRHHRLPPRRGRGPARRAGQRDCLQEREG